MRTNEVERGRANESKKGRRGIEAQEGEREEKETIAHEIRLNYTT